MNLSPKILQNLVRKSGSIAIIAHRNPDADAICSVRALQSLLHSKLRKMNFKIQIFFDGEISSLCEPLLFKQKINNIKRKKYSLAFALDCATPEQMGQYKAVFDNAEVTACIDHHITNTGFAQYNHVDAESSSTCEIIYYMFKSLTKKFANEVCKLIYTGILTDTANLNHNVSDKTHKNLAELVKKDFDKEGIKKYFFNSSKNKIKLLEKSLHSLKFYANDKIALMKITTKELQELDCGFEDTVGLVEHANNISGVIIAGVFIELTDNKYYCSLRSKGEVDVSVLAKEFNGGGHKEMAAFQFEGDYTKIKNRLLDLATDLLSGNIKEQDIKKLFA